MLSIHTQTHTTPAHYQLGKLPRPTIDEHGRDILIKVHAASVNPIDVKKASGVSRMVLKDSFPYKVGYDCAGVIEQVGSQVTRLKVGDEVFARLPECHRGSWSEYAKTTEEFVALKPQNCSMVDAASVPLAAMTALQCLRQYRGHSLEGKTVLVPAGLSGVGLFACQLAKNVFKAGKVITTVSTAKVPMVESLLGAGVVDQVIDYTKSKPASIIPAQSVDFLLDTVGASMDYLSLMRPDKGTINTISILTSGNDLQDSSLLRLTPDGGEKAIVPFPIRYILNLLDYVRRTRAWLYGVEYRSIFLDPNWQDLNMIRTWIEEGKLRTVVGTSVHYKDLPAVRAACQVVYDEKGGIGKTVIVFD